MYHIDPSTGKRVYTLKKVNEATGKATMWKGSGRSTTRPFPHWSIKQTILCFPRPRARLWGSIIFLLGPTGPRPLQQTCRAHLNSQPRHAQQAMTACEAYEALHAQQPAGPRRLKMSEMKCMWWLGTSGLLAYKEPLPLGSVPYKELLISSQSRPRRCFGTLVLQRVAASYRHGLY